MKTMKTEKLTTKPQLSEAARLAKNAYMSEYARKNPEKIRIYYTTYWEKKAAKALVTDKNGSNVTNVTLKTNVTTVTKCQYCGSDLSDKRAGARYCSTNCRVNFNRKTSK